MKSVTTNIECMPWPYLMAAAIREGNTHKSVMYVYYNLPIAAVQCP